jgi:uncharacterized membrane protein
LIAKSAVPNVERDIAPTVENGVGLSAAPLPRLASTDRTRWPVIVVMVLEHAREMFLNGSFDPLNDDATNLPNYLPRWITHLGAPAFYFLLGNFCFLMGKLNYL